MYWLYLYIALCVGFVLGFFVAAAFAVKGRS